MKEFQLQFIVNKQIKRVFKLLDTFEHNSTHNFKSLETKIGVSDRTILTDTYYVREHFKEAIRLESSPLGYIFTVLDQVQYTKYKQLLVKDEPLFEIIEKIFFNHCLTLAEWSDALHLSESSILRYLKSIEPILNKYEIAISKNKLDFIGNEINIRHFFYDFYYESSITAQTVFPPSSLQEITLSLRQENFFDEYAPIAFGSFNYLIYIATNRFFKGKSISKLPEELNFLKDSLKPSYYKNIKEIVVAYFGQDLNDDEKLYIYAILLCKRSLIDFHAEMKFLEKVPPNRLVIMWAEEYAKVIKTPYNSKDKTLVFLESYFNSVYLKTLLSPVLNQNVHDINHFTTERFGSLYNKTHEFIHNQLKPALSLTVDQVKDISANLTIYTDSITLMYWKSFKNIAFLLEGNQYMCENIRAIATKTIGKYHNLFFPDAADMTPNYFKENNIDIIVTNYSEYIPNFSKNHECVLFEVIPTKEDWKKLTTVINPRYSFLLDQDSDK